MSSKIAGVDSVSGKDMSSMFLGTRFELITVSHTETFTFERDSCPVAKSGRVLVF